MEVLLWLAVGLGLLRGASLWFALMPILYSAWRKTGEKDACPKCSSLELIPLDTPRGQQLSGKYPESSLPAEPIPRGVAWRGFVFIALAVAFVIGIGWTMLR